MNNKISNLFPHIAFFGAVMLTAFLCITLQGNYAINGNISWLLIGAERLLDGKTMVEHIYESNPPLSIIIYIPHVLLSHLTGISLPIGSFYVTLALALLSTFTSYQIIKRYTFLDKPERLGFITCYAAAITLTTVVYFSEREHIMLLAIAPFMLAQFALMEKIPLPRYLSIPVFIIGALGFLIKPHYGLVPTIFLLSRAIKHKNLNPVKHPDFIALSAVTLLYLGAILTIFDDYVQIILPDILSYYIGLGHDYLIVLQASALQALQIVIFLFLELLQSNNKNARNRLIRFLYLCAGLFLIPYYVQMKGYFNHLIPANSFFMMAVCCSIMLRLSPIATQKLKWKKTTTSSLTIITPFLCVLGLSHLLTPLSNSFVTRKDMRTLPVARYLEENCKQPCSFYAFHPDIEIMPSTALAMNYEYASRFSVLWTLPGVLKDSLNEDPKVQESTLKNKERYAHYLLEDLEYYEPSLLMIAKDILTPINNISVNFMDFFKTYSPLQNYITAHYARSDSFEFDRGPYFKGTSMDYPHTLYYDIYMRRD